MENLNLNIFNLIILMGIIQGFIFGFIIIFNKKLNNKTNLFLAFTSFSLSISNLQHWFIDSKMYLQLQFLNIIRIPTEFLIISMFYLFVNRYLEIKISNKKIILLTIPFFLDFTLKIFLRISSSFKIGFMHSNTKILGTSFYEELFCLLFSISLIIKSFLLVEKYEKGNKNSNDVKAKTKWLTNILKIGVITCVIWFGGIVLFSYFKQNNETSIFYPLWICITVIIYWLSYTGLFQSNVFHERKEIRKNLIKEINTNSKKTKTDNLFETFENFVSQNFFNPNLSLEFVAENINTNSSYLSQVINSQEIKFNDYVNKLRIEQAKKMLQNKEYSNYTISAIGLEAGFNSNASFYRAFKKHTGLSPKEFKK